MPSVRVELPHHRYDVTIEPGSLSRLGAIVRDVAPHRLAALVADEYVAELHGATAEASLRDAGYRVTPARVLPGEDQKTLDTVRLLYDCLLNDKLERRSPVVALGGGVVGDTAGFVAATYLRGVPFVQVPTTLLAMVDASVGGKVGVNVPQGKNLIGAFHQPVAVVIDPMVLATLPPRELRCGLAECIKHAAIRDASRLEWIESRFAAIAAVKPAVMSELVAWNVAIKAAVVMADERETGERAHLNFGHTFAHAIEATAGYGTFHHGEAVALGMVAASNLAAELGLCDGSVARRIAALCQAVGLPVRAALPPDPTLIDAMMLDKKVKDARLRFVLPTRLGEVVVRDDVPLDPVARAWATIRSD